MPKHNPKLDKPDSRKKRESFNRETDSYDENQNHSPFYMALIFIGLVIVVAILFVYVFNDEGIRIEKDDEVKLNYEIFTYSAYEKREDPFISHMDTWINVCSRYDDTCEVDGIIDGFYNELVGRRVGDTLNYKFIMKCIDANEDGIDDYSGKLALSYGFPNDTYFNTDIVLYFHILAVNKNATIEETAATSTYRDGNNNEKALKVLYYIIIVNRKNPLSQMA